MEKVKKSMNVEMLDEETTRMAKRIVVLRVATKHINLWIRQLEMKRMEMSELAGLMKLDEVKEEMEREKSLETWARTATNHFTKKVKRMGAMFSASNQKNLFHLIPSSNLPFFGFPVCPSEKFLTATDHSTVVFPSSTRWLHFRLLKNFRTNQLVFRFIQ